MEGIIIPRLRKKQKKIIQASKLLFTNYPDWHANGPFRTDALKNFTWIL